MNIGDTIAFLRQSKGWTQSELAERADIAVTALSMIETGYRDPSKKMIISISGALNISLDVVTFLSLDPDKIPVSKRSEFSELHSSFKEMVKELL